MKPPRPLNNGTDEPGRQILDSIRRIVQELRVASRRSEAKMGLSGAQLFVLQKLRDGRSVSLNMLSSRTLTHQSSVSVVVQRLVERGLVQRLRAGDDARRLELNITPAGRKVLRHAPGAAQDRLIGAIENMAVRDRKTLAHLLGSLVQSMGIAGKEPSMLFEEKNRSRNGNGA